MKNFTSISLLVIILIQLYGCAANPAEVAVPVDWASKIPEIISATPDSSTVVQKQVHGEFNCIQRKDYDNSSLHQKVSVEFLEYDLRDAFMELSMITGVNFLLDDFVSGIVSLNFNDVTLNDIVETLVKVGEFDFFPTKHAILVGYASHQGAMFSQLSYSCSYHPVFQTTSEIIALMPEQYASYLRIESISQTIIITAGTSIQHRIQHEINLADHAVDQVVLELSIIEVSSEALDLIGIDWLGAQGKYEQVMDADLSSTLGGTALNLSGLKARHFLQAIKVMDLNGKAHIKSMPTIITLNGKEAHFQSLETVWHVRQTAQDNANRNELSYGVRMTVIPKISSRNQVQLNIIQASVSDLVLSQQGIPKLISHSISSSVNIKDGSTLILGGLLQDSNRQNKQGIISLNRLPVVGPLFNQHSNKTRRTEILIMIRPSIIRG